MPKVIKDLSFVKIKILSDKNSILKDWQKEIIDERLRDYYKNPDDVIDFEKTIDDIEKDILQG